MYIYSIIVLAFNFNMRVNDLDKRKCFYNYLCEKFTII